jgi:hypothetical protein
MALPLLSYGQELVSVNTEQVQELQGFKMYPNPVYGDEVYVTTATNGSKQIKIYDVFGEVVLTDKISTNTLNISRLVPGVYVLMDSANIQHIFSISDPIEFELLALKIFRFQYKNNPTYQTYCEHLGKTPSNVLKVEEIPFLPIQFFKTHKISSSFKKPEAIFESSGTTLGTTSKHYVANVELYQQSYVKGFTTFYGPIQDYCVLALLPSYLEREGSSLIYMVDDLVDRSQHPDSGFYLYDLETLRQKLVQLVRSGSTP